MGARTQAQRSINGKSPAQLENGDGRGAGGLPPVAPEVHPKSWTVNNVFICNEFDTVSDSFRLTVI